MADIDYIINLRKNYVVELYESFNKIENELLPISQKIKDSINEMIIEEDNYWIKWQNRIAKLERFNSEIELVNRNNLSHSKLVEIDYLQDSFFKQTEDAKKHYLIVFSKLNNIKQGFINEIINNLLLLNQTNKSIKVLQKEVAETYPDLLDYCEQWKKKPIEVLFNITSDIYEIEQLCNSLDIQLQMYEANFINDEFPSLDKIKSIFFAEQCNNLSEKLENFLNNHNVPELLNKLKTEQSASFKEEFNNILGHKGLKSIRNNIRVVLTVSSTQKKLFIIQTTFQKLQNILLPELQKLQQKKQQLLKLCSNAEELSHLTAQKWIISYYHETFGQIEQLIKEKTHFLNELE